MRRQIYLDCDGVLADFDRGAQEILGQTPRAFEKRHGLAAFCKRLARAPEFFANLIKLPVLVASVERPLITPPSVCM